MDKVIFWNLGSTKVIQFRASSTYWNQNWWVGKWASKLKNWWQLEKILQTWLYSELRTLYWILTLRQFYFLDAWTLFKTILTQQALDMCTFDLFSSKSPSKQECIIRGMFIPGGSLTYGIEIVNNKQWRKMSNPLKKKT